MTQAAETGLNFARRHVWIRLEPRRSGARAAVNQVVVAERQMVVVEPFSSVREKLWVQTSPEQLGAAVLGTLAVLSGLLMLQTVFVVTERLGRLRRREAAVRAALGASRGRLFVWLYLHVAAVVVAGVVIGCIGVAVIGRLGVVAVLDLREASLSMFVLMFCVVSGFVAISVIGPVTKALDASLVESLKGN